MTDENAKTTTVSGQSDAERESQAGRQKGSHPPVKGVSIFGFGAESRAQQAGLKKGDVISPYDGEGDLSTETLANIAAATSLPGISVRVGFIRDGVEHSVELQPGSLGIRAMDVILPGSVESEMVQSRDERAVRVIQNVYLTFALLGIFVLLAKLAGAKDEGNIPLILLSTILHAAVYLLLRTRSEGAIPLVLILCAFQCLRCITLFPYPPGDLKELLLKTIVFSAFLFYAYQILFFCRPSVRALFKEKGTLVY
ncbi:MAG: hypothetical protein HY914_09195 [Desulfomonile tiedjei]|nr:hypothetical protein [Desulfomonile tiedjei]